MNKWQRVTITLDVTGLTNRDPWEWGNGLASFLQGEIQEYPENAGITVECMDAVVLKDPVPEPPA